MSASPGETRVRRTVLVATAPAVLLALAALVLGLGWEPPDPCDIKPGLAVAGFWSLVAAVPATFVALVVDVVVTLAAKERAARRIGVLGIAASGGSAVTIVLTADLVVKHLCF